MGRDRGVRFAGGGIGERQMEEEVFAFNIDDDSIGMRVVDRIVEPFAVVGAGGAPVDDEEEGVFTAFIEGNILVELVVGVVEADAEKSLALQALAKVGERLIAAQLLRGEDMEAAAQREARGVFQRRILY